MIRANKKGASGNLDFLKGQKIGNLPMQYSNGSATQSPFFPCNYTDTITIHFTAGGSDGGTFNVLDGDDTVIESNKAISTTDVVVTVTGHDSIKLVPTSNCGAYLEVTFG